MSIVFNNISTLGAYPFEAIQPVGQADKHMVTHWMNMVGRPPLVGQYILCPRDITVDEACDLIKSDPKYPGVIGIDCEFFNGKKLIPWTAWSVHRRKKSAYIGKYGTSNIHGPFVRLIQLARCDGCVIVFDLIILEGIPQQLLQFLTSESTSLIGFGSKSDTDALTTTDARCASLVIQGDTQNVWSALQHKKVVEYVEEKYGTTIEKHYQLPYNIHRVTPSAANLVQYLFGYKIDKDEGLQGRGFHWLDLDRLESKQLGYAALDALISLDLYLAIDRHHDAFFNIKAEIAPRKYRVNLSLLPEPVCTMQNIGQLASTSGTSASRITYELKTNTPTNASGLATHTHVQHEYFPEFNSNTESVNTSHNAIITQEHVLNDGLSANLTIYNYTEGEESYIKPSRGPTATTAAEQETMEVVERSTENGKNDVEYKNVIEEALKFIREKTKIFRHRYGRRSQNYTPKWSHRMEADCQSMANDFECIFGYALLSADLIRLKGNLMRRCRERVLIESKPPRSLREQQIGIPSSTEWRQSAEYHPTAQRQPLLPDPAPSRYNARETHVGRHLQSALQPESLQYFHGHHLLNDGVRTRLQ